MASKLLEIHDDRSSAGEASRICTTGRHQTSQLLGKTFTTLLSANQFGADTDMLRGQAVMKLALTIVVAATASCTGNVPPPPRIQCGTEVSTTIQDTIIPLARRVLGSARDGDRAAAEKVAVSETAAADLIRYMSHEEAESASGAEVVCSRSEGDWASVGFQFYSRSLKRWEHLELEFVRADRGWRYRVFVNWTRS